MKLAVLILVVPALFFAACGEQEKTPKTGTAPDPVPPVVAPEPEPPARPVGELVTEAFAAGRFAEVRTLAAGGSGAEVREIVSGLIGGGEYDLAGAARLLAGAPLPPGRELTKPEATVIEGAWGMIQRRRADEAERLVASLPEDIAETFLLRGFLAVGEGGAVPGLMVRAATVGVEPGMGAVAAGRLLAQSGDLEGAEEVLRGTDHPRAHGPLALVILVRHEDLEGALSEAAKGHDADPEDTLAARTRALLLILLSRLDEAGAILEDLLVKAPDDPEVWETEGVWRMRRGEKKKAITAFEKTLELDPGSSMAHRNLAVLLLSTGRTDEGLGHLEKALDALEVRSVGFVGRATGLGSMEFERTEEVIAPACVDLALRRLSAGASTEKVTSLLDHAVKADPAYPRARYVIAELHCVEGDLAGAINALTEGAAAMEGPARDDMILHLAVKKLLGGDPEGYTEALKGIGPDTPLGHLLDRTGAPDADGRVLLADRPRPSLTRESDRYAALARSFLGEESAVRNGTAFRKFIDEKGAIPFAMMFDDPREELAAGRPVLVEWLEAAPEGPRHRITLLVGYDPGLECFLVEDPEPGDLVLLPEAEVRGGLLFRRPEAGVKPHPAAAALARVTLVLGEGRVESAEEIEPAAKHALAVSVLAKVDLSKGDIKGALARIRAALEADPEQAGLRLFLAQTLLFLGEVGLAIQEVNKVEELTGLMAGSPMLRRLRALAHMREGGELEQGIEDLEAIRADHPGYLRVYEDLASVYLSREEFSKAVDVLLGLAARFPNLAKEKDYRKMLQIAYRGVAGQATTAKAAEPLVNAAEVNIRKAAVRVAQELPYAEQGLLLHRLVRDADPEVRALATRVLGQQKHTESQGVILECLRDDAPLVRAAAIRSLGKIAGLDALPDIVVLLRDGDKYVRDVAGRTLTILSGKDMGFKPDGTAEEREEGALRWERWIKSR